MSAKEKSLKISKKVPYCPECNINVKNCDCNFNCPACNEEGQYTDDHLLCPTGDCRVQRFYTQ